ncbi:tumor protein p53-inducible protein 13 isoform X5 [Nycticebus coucang]|uniref:tumor protein p53-inducible protein 13 isoform X5 n=1 Tax=Nycticebus coucang TaxID=9470 RepID=UPI00234C4340|nr:tumor protein p53-inducible protein 13 isoform X5 [Nycticebus coucang]
MDGAAGALRGRGRGEAEGARSWGGSRARGAPEPGALRGCAGDSGALGPGWGGERSLSRGSAGRSRMAPPPPSPQLLLLAALARLLDPSKVVAGLAEEAGARCPEGLWPLPPQVSPRVTCTPVSPGQPLALTAWGVALEMAWVEPAWAAHWLKRRKRLKQSGIKAWFHCDSLSGLSPLVPSPGRGPLCLKGCTQALALAFALRSWRPPGSEVSSRRLRQLFSSGAKRRGLRAAVGFQPTLLGLRVPSASPWSLKARQSPLGVLHKEGNAPYVPTVPLLPAGPGGNTSPRTEAQVPSRQGSPGGCACPNQGSPAPRAVAPSQPARGPTPRTEEAAWAAMALTFLLVLLTLATLCTRLHRNFRRGESIYWGPTGDSQDTVAAVLKRRLLMPARRVKRSRRRPLLPPTPDSGPDDDSSE